MNPHSLLLLLVCLFFGPQVHAQSVRCCISTFLHLREVWVNEVNITDSVQGSLTNYSESKYVEFEEPATMAVIGIKGFENREVYVGAFQIQCACDRPGSAWNFASENTTGVWKAMPSFAALGYDLSPGWYFNNRTTGLKQPVLVTTQPSIIHSDTRCGNPALAARLQAVQGQKLYNWAFRRLVYGAACALPLA